MFQHFARALRHVNLHSIKYKYLFATLLMFLVFVLTLFYIWYTNLTAEAQTQARDSIHSIMQVSNTSFEADLQDVDNVAVLLTSHSSNYLTSSIVDIISAYNNMAPDQLYRAQIEANDFLISLCSFKKYLTGLTVTDLQGNSMTYGITTPFATLQQFPWYGSIANSTANSPIFIAPYNQDPSDPSSPVLAIVRPILKNGGEVGFVLAEIDQKVLNDTFNVQGLDGMSLAIGDGSLSKFIYRSQDIPKSLNADALKRMKSQITGSDGDFYITLGQTKELIVYHRSPLTGWITIGVIPFQDVMRNFYDTRNKIIGISVIFLPLVVFVIYMLSTLLTKNLFKINQALLSFGEGRLDTRLSIRAKDETAQIARQFDRMADHINDLIKYNKHVEQEKREAEINALQNQVTPHFLYNTLNTIRFLSTLQGADNIRTVAENLAALLHTSLDHRRFIALEEEMQILQDYIEIQKFRYSNQFHAEIAMDPDLAGCLIPKLILQPLVENALVHGISPLHRMGLVTVQPYVEDGELMIRVKDNGVGMPPQMIERILSGKVATKHIGLYNVDSRIKKYFGNRYGLSINSGEGLFTIVTIRLPLLHEGDINDVV